MTVSSTNTKNSYSGNGSTTVFAYTFKIFDDDDITVILRTDATGVETVQTKTTDYTVSGVGNAGGGNITFGTAPASGITVVLLRETAQTQSTDYTPNDPFPAASHEDALDKLTLIVQDQQEELDRSIKVSRTNTITSPEFTVGATDRANRIFAFDSNGDLSVTQEIGTYQGTDATITTSPYSERDIIKSTTAGELNNVYICTAASVAGDLLTDTDHFELLVDAVTAATSAAAAASSATDAETAQTAAEAAQAAAETAETNAETAETNAETAETNAETAQAAAEAAQAAAETAETNAGTSETNAATSATASATSAAASAASASAASTSESNASTSEANAASSASSASTSASTATTQAGIATTKAGEAATSATNAATSATSAATAQTAAESAQAAAELALDNFDDVYLGAKSSDPTVDNDGDALTAGDLYFNTTSSVLKYYTGSAWESISPGITDIVSDTTPQLGGNLDVNGNDITGTGDINITGTVTADGLTVQNTAASNAQIAIENTSAATSTDYKIVAGKVGVSNEGFSIYDSANATTAYYIDSSGNHEFLGGKVGIGTDSPSVELEIASSAPQMRITDTDTNAVFQINASSTRGGVEIQADATDVGSNPFMAFDVGGSEKVRILDNGNVGIGTSSPAVELEIASGQPELRLTDTDGTDQESTFVQAGGTLFLNLQNNTNNGAFRLRGFGGGVGTDHLTVLGSGNVGIGTSSPSAKLNIYHLGFNSGSTTSVSALKVQGSYGGGITISDTAESGFYSDTSGTNLRMYVGKTASDTPASKLVMTANSSGLNVSGTVTATSFVGNGAATVYVRWENVGTVSTADSFGVSSITDNASADDTVSFSNSFSADDFSSGGHAGQGGGTASDPARSLHQRETATGSTRVRTAYPANMSYQEAGYASLIIHGDLA